MKKLLSIFMLLVAIVTGAKADSDPDLAIGTTEQTTSTFLGEYTDEGITISSDQSYSSGAVQLGSTPSGDNAYKTQYLQIAAGAEIEKVSFLISGNGSNKSIQAPLFGWAETPSSNTADTYVLLDAKTVTANSYAAAQWFDYDLSNANVKYVRIYRATKNISSIDPAYTGSSTALGKETIKIYGIKVWLKSTGPSISASKVNITEDGTNEGEIAFTVDDKGTTGTVTAAKKGEANWLTLGDVDNTNGKVPFTATANTTSSARVATVTLTYTYNTNETVTKDVTITQAPNVKGTAIIRLTLPGGTKTGDAPGTIGGTYDGKTQDRNTSSGYGGCKLGSTGHYIGLTLATGNSFQEGDIVEVKFVGEAPQTGDDSKVIFYDSKEQTNVIYNTETSPALGTYRYILPEGANGQTSLYLVRGTNKNSKFNPFIDYIAVYRPATVTLNAKGYATYSKATDFEFLGAKAYGMELTTTSLTGHEATGKIKAGEGILFKGEAGAKVYITETTGAEALTNNSLIGTTDADNEIISSSYTYKYALSGDTFKKLTGALVANKAFFGTNEELSNSLDLVFDGATAINNVNANDNANSVAPVKVIKNGKLYIGNYNVAGARIK